MLYVHN